MLFLWGHSPWSFSIRWQCRQVAWIIDGRWPGAWERVLTRWPGGWLRCVTERYPMKTTICSLEPWPHTQGSHVPEAALCHWPDIYVLTSRKQSGLSHRTCTRIFLSIFPTRLTEAALEAPRVLSQCWVVSPELWEAGQNPCLRRRGPHAEEEARRPLQWEHLRSALECGHH